MLHLFAAAVLSMAPQAQPQGPTTTPPNTTSAPNTAPTPAAALLAAAQSLPADALAALVIPPVLGSGLQDLEHIAKLGSLVDQLAGLWTLPEQLPATRLGRALRNGAAIAWLPGDTGQAPAMLMVADLGAAQSDIVPALSTLPTAPGEPSVRIAAMGNARLHFAVRDGKLAIATSTTVAIAALERSKNATNDSLANDPAFVQSVAHATKQRIGHAFVRPSLLAAQSPSLPEAVRQAWSTPATKDLVATAWISAGWQVAGREIATVIDIGGEQAPQWLRAWTSAKTPVPATLAQYVPTTVGGYSLGVLDPATATDAILPLVEALAPRLAAAGRTSLANAETQTGTKLTEILREQFTGQFATITSTTGDLGLVAAVTDGTEFFKLLQKVVPALGLAIQNGTCTGTPCWRAPIEGAATTPVFAVVGNTLVLASSDEHFTALAEQVQHGKPNAAAAEAVRMATAQGAVTWLASGKAPLLPASWCEAMPELLATATQHPLSIESNAQHVLITQTMDGNRLLELLTQIVAPFASSTLVGSAHTETPRTDIAAASMLARAEQEGPGHETTTAVLALLTHPDSRIAARAAWLLGEWKLTDSAAPLAETSTQHSSPQVRFQAMNALTRVASEQVLDPIISASSDPDRKIRTLAVQALGRIRTEPAIDAVLGLLERQGKEAPQETPTDLVAALLVLQEFGDAANLLPAANAITFDNAQVARALVWLFQELSPKLGAAVEAETLVAELDHPSAMLRGYSIQRLGELRNPATLTALEARLTRENKDLQPLLQVSLAQIRGETPKLETDWLTRAKHNGTAIVGLVRDHWSGLSDERRLTVLASTGGALLVALLLAVFRRRAKKRRDAAAVVAMVAPSRTWQQQQQQPRGRTPAGTGSSRFPSR